MRSDDLKRAGDVLDDVVGHGNIGGSAPGAVSVLVARVKVESELLPVEPGVRHDISRDVPAFPVLDLNEVLYPATDAVVARIGGIPGRQFIQIVLGNGDVVGQDSKSDFARACQWRCVNRAEGESARCVPSDGRPVAGQVRRRAT